MDDLDVLMLRNVPSDDYLSRPWAATTPAEFARTAMRHGVIVLSDPNGLAKASSKMYFQLFPEEVRPSTLHHSRSRRNQAFRQGRRNDRHQAAARVRRRERVSWCARKTFPNLNQMIDAVSRDGFVIAQEYLACGGTG